MTKKRSPVWKTWPFALGLIGFAISSLILVASVLAIPSGWLEIVLPGRINSLELGTVPALPFAIGACALVLTAVVWTLRVAFARHLSWRFVVIFPCIAPSVLSIATTVYFFWDDPDDYWRVIGGVAATVMYPGLVALMCQSAWQTLLQRPDVRIVRAGDPPKPV